MKIFNLFAFILLVIAVVATTAFVVNAHSIEHVVVLMLENRAMDHIFGAYENPEVDGVVLKGNTQGKPATCNPINIDDASAGEVCATDDAFLVARCDPNHDWWCQGQKTFGYNAFKAGNVTNPTMKGFVDAERRIGHAHEGEYCDVMKVFNRKTLPIHYSIADNFAMFNKFYPSFDGPTWPNRLFTLLGSSFGLTETSIPWFNDEEGRLYDQKSIIDQVLEAGLSAQIVVNDTTWETMISSIAHNPEIVKLSSDFMEDAKKGDLPSFAYVNPRAGVNVNTGAGSQDFHPDHPSWEAEGYVKDLYEALRASPKWNNTLLILTYDENGGFSDHVPTPLNVPHPGDDTPSWPDKDVKFDRLGIRIPTMLISPWAKKNFIIQDPLPEHRPHENSKFELTSIMGSIRRILKIPDVNLTQRDAFAARFDYILDMLDEPRTDLPLHLPDVFKPSELAKYSTEIEPNLELNGLQKYFAKVHGHLSGRGYPDHIKKQGEISQWLQDAHADHKKKTLKWKASKTPNLHSKHSHHRTKKNILEGLKKRNKLIQPEHTVADQYHLRCQAMIQDEGMKKIDITNSFAVTPFGAPARFRTISANLTESGVAEKYCFTTSENVEAGSEVGVSICYPQVGALNSDPHQQFVFPEDFTIRPYNQQNLCLTNKCYTAQEGKPDFVKMSTPLTLEPCKNLGVQHWSYLGSGNGMHTGQSGTINFGSAIMAVAVCSASNPQC